MDAARLASYWAGRYSWVLETRNDLDREDLQQAAYLGILEARKAYKEERGGEVTLAGFYARNEIRALIGIRCGGLPPAMESLDEPLNDETDDTRLDLLADESLPEIDAGLLEEEKRQTVRDAVERLKPDQKAVVNMRFFQGMTYKETAAEMGVTPERAASIWDSARRNLSRDRYLKAVAEVNRRTPYLLGVGVTRFNSTLTSAVEEIVMLRERLLAQLLRAQDTQEDDCKQQDKVV